MLRITAILPIVFILAFSVTSDAQSAVFTYPGVAPCNTTLQACVDGISAGDTVQIVTNTPINESPELHKSLTLKAAPGFKPVLAANKTIVALSGGNTNNSFTIEGITLERGIILVVHFSTGTLTANIIGNKILESFTTNAAITIRVGNTSPPVMVGNISFLISGNEITVPAATRDSEGISIQSGNNPRATGAINGNDIVMGGNSQGAAIDLANGDNILVVDVIGNTISGSNYNTGIFLFQFSPPGSTTARVINNLITGQSGHSGAPAAISILGDEGIMNALVINNTVTKNGNGVSINGRKDLGGVVIGDVANNIIAFNSQSGLSIDPDFVSTVSNSNNLLYQNKSDVHSLGPGTLKNKNPKFLGTDDFRLQPGSPAINKGSNTKVPADITTDLNDNPRIILGTVDIGAFEFQNEIDLTGNWVSLTQTCRQTPGGQKCSLSGKLSAENAGDGDAPSSLVKFYLSVDGTFQPGVDTFLKQIATGVVKASKSKTLTMNSSLPTGVVSSGKFVIAVIDSENTVGESNEANNIIVFGPVPF